MREIFANCINHNKDVNGNLCSVLEEYRTSCTDNIDAKTDEQFLDAIVELLFFGAETISSAGFSIIYNLTKEGQSLEKLRQEIQDKGLLDVTDDVYSPHDLQQMTFANAVVKETLRMLPPVGGAYRKVIQTFQLEVRVIIIIISSISSIVVVAVVVLNHDTFVMAKILKGGTSMASLQK